MRIESNSGMNRHNNQVESREQRMKELRDKTRKQNMMMFLSIFAVLLLIFLGLARIMSPDVDISLGEDNPPYEQDDDYRRSVDGRLRLLQQDDEMNLTEHDTDDTLIEDDGVVNIPKFEEKTMLKLEEEQPVPTETVKEPENLKSEVNAGNTEDSGLRGIAATDSKNTPSQTAPTPQPQKTYRVYVGTYSTPAQADVAKGILQEAGLGFSPSIKQTAGGYTLQVGAFNSKESATALANKLLQNNYPARVVSD